MSTSIHPKKHMRIHPEIKEFTKNTLIFTLFFTLVIHLGWGYITPYLGQGAKADNEKNFVSNDIQYMGNIATALSLNIGKKSTVPTGVNSSPTLGNEALSVSELLSSPQVAEEKFIATNMLAMQSYLNLLRTDIAGLLDESERRGEELDEHIDLLKSYYLRTAERTSLLAEQRAELNLVLQTSIQETEAAKKAMEEKYKAFEYSGVDSVIDVYIRAKNEENRARVYLTYVDKFQRGYAILQTENKKILDTVINNREALVNKSVVVIPDSGSELLRKLNLIVSEEEYKGANREEQ